MNMACRWYLPASAISDIDANRNDGVVSGGNVDPDAYLGYLKLIYDSLKGGYKMKSVSLK